MTSGPLPRLRKSLQRHPFPMVTTLRDSFVLLYAVDVDALASFCPPGLDLERIPTPNGDAGLIAVATVRAQALRPRGTPQRLGRDFHLTGYRVIVKFRSPDRTIRRALRIISSDTDSRLMAVGGNIFTEYTYDRATITSGYDASRSTYSIRIARNQKAALDATARITNEDFLPPSSPFPNARAARRFTGPLPWTVAYDQYADAYVAVRGHRSEWHPRLVQVDVRTCSFFDRPEFNGFEPTVAAAFYLDDVAYSWDRGIVIARADGCVDIHSPSTNVDAVDDD
jgi:hypothetical protein